MYEQHFGLREAPFLLTPDTGYFYAWRAHQEALNVLRVALAAGEGFIKITGEVGTGKTLLCRKLLAAAGDGLVTAWLPNALLEPDALHEALAGELGIEAPREAGRHRQLALINQRLIDIAAQGGRVVVCLDEAQAMPDHTLEALRLLSNLETERRKLMTVILFGQPELDQRLAADQLRQLRSRIGFSYRLQALDFDGLRNYVAHRLQIAGCARAATLFRPGALRCLHQGSRGIARLVNILAHKSLLAAYGEGASEVHSRHALRAIADTEDATPVARFGLTRLRATFASLAPALAATLLLGAA
ncbi:AAA family ATPase [Pseudothauera nasutitermitis]|uniref:AAA family ATPase n=1 Tax=Pseudothauera nasutitermitis TaxID=2565930 RepID=A0A4S4AUI5_9RHOO|nr:AAA family ATPase [Pseudothauera nasutitermitis]THF63586.1 AAA family ATPase [Pseudothauera nasutitermitis]